MENAKRKVQSVGSATQLLKIGHSEERSDEESLLVDMSLLERFFATLRMTMLAQLNPSTANAVPLPLTKEAFSPTNYNLKHARNRHHFNAIKYSLKSYQNIVALFGHMCYNSFNVLKISI